MPSASNRPRLPPLHDLTAFEAAARHMSFLKASEELCLTQSAVSHRIKALEEFLGVALFIRINRNIALTSFGERYLADVREILDRLSTATLRLVGDERTRVRISAAPALGARWLVTRLADFQRAHPHIELVVSSSYDLELIRRGEADIGIRYGAEPESGLECVRLLQETIFPVASAAYVDSIGGLASPRDLEKAQLLRHPMLSWQRWFAAAGVVRDEPSSGILFEDASLMYEAAAAGQGVALGLKTLFEGNARDGLVKPFELEAWDNTYNMILSPAASRKPEVAAFCEWLLDAASQNVTPAAST